MVCTLSSGCAAWRDRSTTDEEVLASRRLSQQAVEAVHQGNLQQAEHYLRDATESCPLDQHARSQFAEVLWQQGQHEAAIAEMQEAQRLSAGDTQMLVRLGQMYLKTGRPITALAQANQAIAQGVESSAVWTLAGDAHLHQNHLDQALSSYYRSLGYQPNQPALQLNVASIQRQLGRHERALSTLQCLAETYDQGQEPTDLLYQQGLALRALGRYELAITHFQTVVNRHPDQTDYLFDLAETELLAGHPVAAQAAVQQAISLDPMRQDYRALALRCNQMQQANGERLPQ